MKKKIFMVLSAVAVLTMGVLIVACSNDSNTLNPNEKVILEEVVTTPTLQKNSAAEWAAFNLEIEKLNAKYLTPEVVGRAMRIGRDSGALSKEEKVLIVLADLWGGAHGVKGGLSFGIWGAVAGAVIEGAIESLLMWGGLTLSGCMVGINPLSSIDGLDSDSLANVIGERHNILIENIMTSNIDVVNMSSHALLVEITNQYERLFGPLPNLLKSSILSMNIGEIQDPISVDIEQATAQYVNMIVDLNGIQKHAYTEEYLEVMDITLADSEEKTQMLAGIGTGYHSASLWEIEGQP